MATIKNKLTKKEKQLAKQIDKQLDMVKHNAKLLFNQLDNYKNISNEIAQLKQVLEDLAYFDLEDFYCNIEEE